MGIKYKTITENKTACIAWVKQARNAIAKGQSLRDFICHTHPDNRSTAYKAYVAVRKYQGFI